MSEEDKMKQIMHLVDELYMLIHESKSTSSVERDSSNLSTLRVGDMQFDITDVEVVLINKVVSGVKRSDGSEWMMQSIQVQDKYGNKVSVNAWDEAISIFNDIKERDTIDILKCYKYELYQGKRQINAGRFAKVTVKNFSGDQHRL